METTFMTIHSLSPDANILFASESIVDILGYQPHEVTGRSCFDYFHPDEVPFARHQHDRSVRLDKATSLHYAGIMGRDGQWVSCEFVFTVVYDVLVACTSIYRQGLESHERRKRAREIRRMFSSSPRDPRYHMLEHLSTKFRTTPQTALHEPRAALILNRFTRTLSVMYATNAVSGILGVTADEFTGKSFYECMQESCLLEAIRCLERAKENDSIAYMRFLYRDPRRPQDLERFKSETSHSNDSEDDGTPLDYASNESISQTEANASSKGRYNLPSQSAHVVPSTNYSDSMELKQDSGHSIFDREPLVYTASPSPSVPPIRGSTEGANRDRARRSVFLPAPPTEIEAVISCTSDGLVVVLRRARPMIPLIQRPHIEREYQNGLFAAPWAFNPIIPAPQDASSTSGPPANDFMDSIRDVAVFAWPLTGINGRIAEYSHGVPRGESVPPTGYPIWDSQAQNTEDSGPENQAAAKWAERGKQKQGSRSCKLSNKM